MKDNNLEKYIGELPPDLQEKARQCEDAAELNELLAENDVELSDDALAAVAGGCTDYGLTRGQAVSCKCTECGSKVHYWDKTWEDHERYYCDNPNCIACQQGWLFADIYGPDGEPTGDLKRVK